MGSVDEVASIGSAGVSSTSFRRFGKVTAGHLQPELPVIDISRFIRGTAAERSAMGIEWDEAFRTVGFCLLSGYEALLPEESIIEMRKHAAAFFAGSAGNKRQAYVDGMVGYLGPGDENVGATAGQPTVLPDLVESLNLPGYQEEGSEWSASGVAEPECPWLNSTWLAQAPDSLRNAARAYWVGATQLMLELMALSEVALGLPCGFFGPAYKRPGVLLRLAYYPPVSESEGDGGKENNNNSPNAQQRYGPHTDYDGFTILQRDSVDSVDGASGGGGLEIKFPGSNSWTPILAKPHTLTINIGDLLARWTNDRWKATIHRVAIPTIGRARSSCSRLSMVFFTGPHPDTVVKCLPSPMCSECEPRYEPITAKEHVQEKIQAAATVRDVQEEDGNTFKKARVEPDNDFHIS